MPWKEIVVDNYKNTIGESQKKDKALIMMYASPNLSFRITARYHDGHFKYYLDCDQAGIYEYWIGVPSVEPRKAIKRIAINLLKSNIGRKNLNCIVDLNKAEEELEREK